MVLASGQQFTSMSSTARLYRIETMVRQRGQVTMRELRDELEVSRATIKRDLEYLRSQLGAPIEYDALSRAYRFDASSRGQRHELPGMWFDERELYSLLMAHQLLSELDSDGTLSRHLQPLLDRIHQMLGSGDGSQAATLLQRVKVISALRRPVPGEFFERCGEALMKRKQLRMLYRTRGRQASGERDVSPQRLVHYRSTWYLDAWCHRADGLRRFALDAIERASVLELGAIDIAMSQVESAMDAGYGIYAGGTRQWALLLFAPQAAPWISREQWHPEQQGRWCEDGSWELRLPYVDDTELLMDLLRQGDQVQVIEPVELRQKLEARLTAALQSSRAFASTVSR